MSDDNDTKEPTLVDKVERAGFIALEWTIATAFALWAVVEVGLWFLGWFA